MSTEFPTAIDSDERSQSPYLFVLMGASNLARGYSALVSCLTHCLHPHPVEFLHAMGPGRGYCAQGGVFNIRYQAIGDGGILDAARKRAPNARKIVALITDTGNDIMYNVPVEDIISCLDSLMRDLDQMGAEVFVHPIPLDVEEDLSYFQFKMLRAVFFPNSPVDYPEAAEAIKRINAFLNERKGGRIHLLPSARDCCGVDKIHFSFFKSHKVWSQAVFEMLSVIPGERTGKVSPLSTWMALVANMGRLTFCDMFPVRKKLPGTF